MYQERYCFRCAHWTDEYGCPVWFVHELHNGEETWRAALDLLIPQATARVKGHKIPVNAQCYTFRKRGEPREPGLTPGQRKGLEEWRTRSAAP